MEKNHGFFSTLKDEVIRSLSPARSRSNSPGRVGPSGFLTRRKPSPNRNSFVDSDQLICRSGSLRPGLGETLTPLKEGPDPDGGEIGDSKRVGLGHWMMVQLSRTPSLNPNVPKRSDLRLLLGVMGAPLAPVHVSTDPLPHLSIKDTPIVCISNSLTHVYYTFIFCGV